MNSIPKIIHQIWIGPNPEPTEWTNTFRIDYIQQNPSYQYMFWNNINISQLFSKYPNIEKIYHYENTWNGKSDILRYLILYEYGGIYIDADSVWVNKNSFDDLLEQLTPKETIFVSHEPNSIEQICGGVMGSVPFHPLLLEALTIIEKYATSQNGEISEHKYRRNMHGASKKLGPGLLQRLYPIYSSTIKVFPSIYFYPISWHGIPTKNYHISIDIPKESITFQYGYSTNQLFHK